MSSDSKLPVRFQLRQWLCLRLWWFKNSMFVYFRSRWEKPSIDGRSQVSSTKLSPQLFPPHICELWFDLSFEPRAKNRRINLHSKQINTKILNLIRKYRRSVRNAYSYSINVFFSLDDDDDFKTYVRVWCWICPEWFDNRTNSRNQNPPNRYWDSRLLLFVNY